MTSCLSFHDGNLCIALDDATVQSCLDREDDAIDKNFFESQFDDDEDKTPKVRSGYYG